MSYWIEIKARLVLFYQQAKGKLTTYVALFIAALPEIREQWADIVANSPNWKWLHYAEHVGFKVVAILLIYARIRRALRSEEK